MEFLEILIDQDLARKKGLDFRVLKPIKLKDYSLSIQCSSGHYCSPRKNLHVLNYTSFEIALINNQGGLCGFNYDVLNDFKRIKEIRELSSGSLVAGWVKSDLVEEFYQFLKTL